MLNNVYLKSLRDQRWALLGWGVGITLLVVVESAMWPSLRDMPNIDQFLQSYPKALREMFDLNSMTTGLGFMNAELFTMVMPLLFIIFGIGRGARMIAGEEESGTLEVLLLTPVSPTSLVLHKAAALATSLFTLGAVLLLVMTVCSWVFDMGIALGDVVPGSLAMVLLGVEFGWLSLALGAATGRRAAAIGLTTVAAVSAYVLYVAGMLVEEVAGWQVLSPVQQALGAGPLGAGLPRDWVWMALSALVCLAAGITVYNRRDVNGR
jgi:ABC-2 type transport system permease protein